MPARKQALVAAAVAALLAALAAAAALAALHPWAGALAVAAIVAAAAAAADARWVAFDLAGTSLRAGRRDLPEVALTFDDGPGPDTPAVLDALERAGVRATFFVLGRAAEAHPDLVRETARRGHLVALHGHTHRLLERASAATVRGEVDRSAAAVRAAGVEPAPFFRAPHGFKGPALRRVMRERGLVLAAWTRGVWDTDRPGAEAIVRRACARMRGGEILLLHDACGDAPPGAPPAPAQRRDQTAEAVQEIVRRWRAAGYRFVTLDALRPAPPRVDRTRAARIAAVAVLALLGALAARDLRSRASARADAAAIRPAPAARP
jgi:peptidoglycan/xylan/chitin deacetylase (PgdA/CDA1 family)